MGIASFERMGKTTACKRTAWVLCGLALAATAAAGDVAYVLRDPGLNHMPVLEIKVPAGYAVKGTVGWNLLLEPVMCGAKLLLFCHPASGDTLLTEVGTMAIPRNQLQEYYRTPQPFLERILKQEVQNVIPGCQIGAVIHSRLDEDASPAAQQFIAFVNQLNQRSGRQAQVPLVHKYSGAYECQLLGKRKILVLETQVFSLLQNFRIPGDDRVWGQSHMSYITAAVVDREADVPALSARLVDPRKIVRNPQWEAARQFIENRATQRQLDHQAKLWDIIRRNREEVNGIQQSVISNMQQTGERVVENWDTYIRDVDVRDVPGVGKVEFSSLADKEWYDPKTGEHVIYNGGDGGFDPQELGMTGLVSRDEYPRAQ